MEGETNEERERETMNMTAKVLGVRVCGAVAGMLLLGLTPTVDVFAEKLKGNPTLRQTIEYWTYAHAVIEVTRGPLSWWGTVDVSATLTIDETVLTSFSLYTGDDSDDDGVLEKSEWTLEEIGSITRTDAQAVGSIPRTTVSARKDAYRLVMVDDRIGMTYEQWGAELKYEDP